MKCLKRGADSVVLETLPHHVIFTHRVRKCSNDHTFSSYEVHTGALSKPELLAAQAGQVARTRADYRARMVLRHPAKSALTLAGELGISRTRVQQIRAAAQLKIA